MTEASTKNATTILFGICNTYKDTKYELKGVLKDLENMTTLCDATFQNYYISPNVPYAKLDEKIDRVAEAIAQTASLTRVIFYFSGHGYQKVEAGELMPGLWTNDMKPVPYSYIIKRLATGLRTRGVTRVSSFFMFVDACRTDIREEKLDYHPIPVEEFVSFIFVYAVEPTESAIVSSKGSHFTNALITCLNKVDIRADATSGKILDVVECLARDEATTTGTINPTFNANRYVRERYPDKVTRLLRLLEETRSHIAVTRIAERAKGNVDRLREKCRRYSDKVAGLRTLVAEKKMASDKMQDYIQKNKLKPMSRASAIDETVIREKIRRYSLQGPGVQERKLQYEKLLRMLNDYFTLKKLIRDAVGASFELPPPTPTENLDSLLKAAIQVYETKREACEKQISSLLAGGDLSHDVGIDSPLAPLVDAGGLPDLGHTPWDGRLFTFVVDTPPVPPAGIGRG